MKPAQSSSIENTNLLSDISAKRKFDGKSSDDSIPNSYVPPPILPPSYTRPPSPKRLKISSGFEKSAAMSKVIGRMSQTNVFANAPRTVPSGFEPHKGAKVLKIKNLRTTQKVDLEDYYDRTWTQLDAAVTATFEGLPTALPLDVLCRGVEATCRRGRAEKLALHLKDRCKHHLEKEVLPRVERDAGSSNVDALRAVYQHWTTWNTHSVSLRMIFSFLDRSYLYNAKHLLQLEEQGIQQFRHAVFAKNKAEVDGKSLGGRVILGVCDLVGFDRVGNPEFDSNLLKESILMFHVFGIFGKSLEPKILETSRTYFESFAKERKTSGIKDYVVACDALLTREATRFDRYNFTSISKRSVLDNSHHILIEECSDVLLDAQGLAKLIDTNEMDALRMLYALLKLSDLQSDLKKPFEVYVKSVGSAIVQDKERIDEMVVRLLELKRSLDLIIRDAFAKDQTFTYSLRESFGNFINDRKNTMAWGTNNSKVGEMIAKYIDILLRGGLKAVPRSLLFDAKDRDNAEKAGQASTGDEDAELDRQLEQALELFRFIEGKDVFEAFYKKDLARRLLMARSASQDAERNMLAKLKGECGYGFTHNLETMFKDQELAREEMVAYKQSLSNTSKTSLDLQVNVLTASAWPNYPDVKINLPPEVAKHIEKYDMYYQRKHTGRRLTWKHALAHSVVRAKFDKGAHKELLVSGFQAIILVLFSELKEGDNLSYEDIKAATGLVDVELQRTLQSLACAKFRVLTKHPRGREVDPTDTFTVNTKFVDPKVRIKINQIQLKETTEENKETHERVHQDRQYETQAAIVRIMKSRKTMAHSNLVAEVISQTRARGAVDPSEIKKNIEKLIEKDYIEREGSAYVYLA